MKSRTCSIAIALLLAWLGACTEDNPFFEDPGSRNPCEVGQLVIESFDLAAPTRVDVLMVVDNSPGMADVQEALSEAMPAFVGALDDISDLDWQLGVVSTDIVHTDQQGRLQTGITGQAGCPGNRPRIITSDTPAAEDVAACSVVLGDDGDAFPAGLEAVRYALLGPAAEPGGPNEGFLRADSRLVVIFVSRLDDCSDDGSLDRENPDECVWDRDLLLPLRTYVERVPGETCESDESCFFFNRIRGNAGQPVDLVAIVGPDDGVRYERPEPPEAVCAANGTAFAGVRYLEVIDAMGDRGQFYNICDRGYADVLESIAQEAIRPHPEAICPFLTLTQPPVSVRLVGGTPEAATPIPEGSEGYLYLGAVDACPTGALLVSPEAHGRLGDNERVELHYCTADPLP